MTLLSDGDFRWRVAAEDTAGNIRTSDETRTFTVDTTAPGAPALIEPEDNAFLNTGGVVFRWRVSAGDPLSYRLQVTSGDFLTGPFAKDENVPHTAARSQQALTAAAAAVPQTIQLTGDLADDVYQWRVIARDALNNASTSDTRSFTVDTVEPTQPTGLTQTTGDGNVTERFNWTRSIDSGFIGSGDLANTGSGVVSYRVAIIRSADSSTALIDVVPDSGCGQNTNICTFVPATPLTVGEYRIEVVAEDNAGNTSDAVTQRFFEGLRIFVQNLQVLNPVVGNLVNISTPRFQWNRPLELPRGISKYDVATGDAGGPEFTDQDFIDFKSNGDFDTVCFAGAVSGDCIVIGIATADKIKLTFRNSQGEGRQRIGVRVVDGQGGTGVAVELIFTVDTTPPGTADLVSPSSGDFLNTSTPTFVWSAATGDPFVYQLLVTVTSGDIRGILKKCVNSQAVYPLSEQHGLKAQERR